RHLGTIADVEPQPALVQRAGTVVEAALAAATCAQPQALVLRQGEAAQRPAAGRAAGLAQRRVGHAVGRQLEPDPLQLRTGAAALPAEDAAVRADPEFLQRRLGQAQPRQAVARLPAKLGEDTA